MKIVSVEKKIVEKLVEECTETVEEMKLATITLAKNENKYKGSSCTLNIVLIIVVFTICAEISTCFVYYIWSLVKNVLVLRQQFSKLINGRTQTN